MDSHDVKRFVSLKEHTMRFVALYLKLQLWSLLFVFSTITIVSAADPKERRYPSQIHQ